MADISHVASTSDTHAVQPTTYEQIVDTRHGPLRIIRVCPSRMLSTLELDAGIGRFARYRSIISSVATLARVAELPDANVTVALSPEQKIIGYIECSYPDAIEGWRDNADGLCYELGAIEVSRNWRQLGVAQAMVATILADAFIETKIFFLTGYSWHWDTDCTGLSVYAYRNLLVRLFHPFGFQVYLTNNPEIRMSTANVLMARTGGAISPEQRLRFQKMLFAFDA